MYIKRVNNHSTFLESILCDVGNVVIHSLLSHILLLIFDTDFPPCQYACLASSIFITPCLTYATNFPQHTYPQHTFFFAFSDCIFHHSSNIGETYSSFKTRVFFIIQPTLNIEETYSSFETLVFFTIQPTLGKPHPLRLSEGAKSSNSFVVAPLLATHLEENNILISCICGIKDTLLWERSFSLLSQLFHIVYNTTVLSWGDLSKYCCSWFIWFTVYNVARKDLAK